MKSYHYLIGFILIITCLFFIPASKSGHFQKHPHTVYTLKGEQHTYETDDTTFKIGDVLLPDYVHTDTLYVVDANLMNWAMQYYDAASDGDISDILAMGTIPYSQINK